MRSNAFNAGLQFSNIASILRHTWRRIMQDLFYCRRRQRTKSPPPKRLVVCCAIEGQSVVIYAVPDFLGCPKTLFIGRIFFGCYGRVFQIVAHNLFYSIKTLNNRICATIIFFFQLALFKNLSYIFFDFSGRRGRFVPWSAVLSYYHFFHGRTANGPDSRQNGYGAVARNPFCRKKQDRFFI